MTKQSVLKAIILASFLVRPLAAQPIELQDLVKPSTVIRKDGHVVPFAVYGFIGFNSLSELFPFIHAQGNRWSSAQLDASRRRELARNLLRRGVESRVVSMIDERPLETLVTHTEQELRQALARVHERVPAGYGDAFIAVQTKWKHSINCWSAAASIPARVLSNWYPIEEGVQLYGATYDSTEHFWQAVKYHPDVTVAQLQELLVHFEERNWSPWLARLDADPELYLANAYAVEFLRHNLAGERLAWFAAELYRHRLQPGDHAREVQQRHDRLPRFTAYEEKVFWGDLADLFHLVYRFSTAADPMRTMLAHRRFNAIYLGDRKMNFISDEFRSLMLEIWKVKFLQMARFREVIRAIPVEIRLEHFLNDGDSPDIPIPVYVSYLNQIRILALAERK